MHQFNAISRVLFYAWDIDRSQERGKFFCDCWGFGRKLRLLETPEIRIQISGSSAAGILKASVASNLVQISIFLPPQLHPFSTTLKAGLIRKQRHRDQSYARPASSHPRNHALDYGANLRPLSGAYG
jgi:hypothetical protein